LILFGVNECQVDVRAVALGYHRWIVAGDLVLKEELEEALLENLALSWLIVMFRVMICEPFLLDSARMKKR
jgi:hypothetical protein